MLTLRIDGGTSGEERELFATHEAARARFAVVVADIRAARTDSTRVAILTYGDRNEPFIWEQYEMLPNG